MKNSLDSLYDLVVTAVHFLAEVTFASFLYWLICTFLIGLSVPFLKVWGLYMIAKITLNKLSEYLP